MMGMETEPENTTLNADFEKETNMTLFPYYQHSLSVAISYILAYLFIFLLCMVGNILVCLTVLGNRHMRTVTNLFIFNLAVSDLLVGIFCIPTTLVDNLITGWPFSNLVCKMSGFVQGVSVSASVFTLVAIAVERFRCVVYLHNKSTKVTAKVAIALIWVLAMAIMCPAAIALTVEEVPFHYMVHNDDSNHTLVVLYTCYEDFANPKMTKFYTAVLFALIYLVPLMVIAIMYGTIGVKLCSSVLAKRKPQGPVIQVRGPRRRKPLSSQKKIQAIKMLFLVTLLFMLSWLPLWTVMIMADYGGLKKDQMDLLISYIFPLTHWLAFANSSINPIIYGYYNENFKKGFHAASNSMSFSSLARCHAWRRITARLQRRRSERVLYEGTNCRNSSGNNSQQLFSLRNRVHNERPDIDKQKPNRITRVSCMGLRSRMSVSHQGIEMATVKRNSVRGKKRGGASQLAVTKQAWDK
ncbi:neuropeptide FF receptor 1-like [Stigmatopora nigra]